MGRVFSQFPSCGFPAAAVILAVPELSSFELTQLIHPSCSCCNTGIPPSPAFISQGSSKAALSCWPALESRLVGAHRTHREKLTTCLCETEAGVMWSPLSIDREPQWHLLRPKLYSKTEHTQGSVPQVNRQVQDSPLCHTRGFFSSDVGHRGSRFNHVDMQSYNFISRSITWPPKEEHPDQHTVP